MKLVFMGTAEWACASLKKLAENKNFSIAAVVTPPDKPRGRQLKSQPSPVKQLAQTLNLPVWQPARARDSKFIADLRALEPELIVVAAYGQILPPAILELPPLGCLNVHASLLPKYRGAAPIQWAIAQGETETGVTIMKMDAGLDTGPILTRRRTPILPEDNAQTLHDRLAQLGADLLVETIPGYVAGQIQAQPQPAEGATLAPKIKKDDGRIDWRRPAREIWNRLRAFTPWPGSFTFFESTAGTQLLKIWQADVVERSGNAGEILSADSTGMVVACGRDALRIRELQCAGGKRMTTGQFLAGHPLKPGQKLGE
ncbi:MAG TPA: methionyl-tRNA formyltransferase [Verrucomicrobiae bacterium]|nr:methionyl-tRNA formyltransferase [Verrucomicrobiae bacterium]